MRTAQAGIDQQRFTVMHRGLATAAAAIETAHDHAPIQYRDLLDEVAQRSGARLAREVNVTIRSAQWWQEGQHSFHREVTRRPIVTVPAAGQS